MRRNDDDIETATLVPCPRCVGPFDDVLDDAQRANLSECYLCADVRLVSADCRRLWIEASRQ